MNTFPAHLERHYLVSTVLEASGVHTVDLRANQLGVFDSTYFKSVGSKLPNEFIFAIGSPHTGDKQSMTRPSRQSNVYSINISRKSEPIDLRTSLISAATFEASTENTYPTWYLGYDGLNMCKALDFTCDTHYYVSAQLSGYAVESAIGKDLQDMFIFKTDCCGDDCKVINSKEKYVDKIVDYFNNKSLVFRDFISTNKVIKYCTPQAPIAKINYKKYCISMCDAGNMSALAKLQSKYKYGITFAGRKDGISTYETEFILATEPVPTPYSAATTVLSDCAICPPGTTSVAGTKVFTVTALNDNSDKTAAEWLTEIQNNYAQAVKAEKVDFTHGTSTYVVHFPSNYSEPAVIPNGTTIEFLKEEKITCVTAPTTYTWNECGSCYKVTRKLKMMVKNPKCAGESYLSELQETYKNYSDVVPNSVIIAATPQANLCNTVYEIEQYSNCIEDGCDYMGTAQFSPLSGWNSFTWEVDVCEGWTVNANGCPVPPIDNDVNFVAGLRFDVKIDDTQLDDSCGYTFNDAYSQEPLFLNVQFGEYRPDFEKKCVQKQVPFVQVSSFSRENGRGQSLISNLVNTEFENAVIIFDPTTVEYGHKSIKAMGINFSVEPNAFYNYVNVVFESSTRNKAHESTSYRTFSYFFHYKNTDIEVGNSIKSVINKLLAKQEKSLI